MDVSLNRAAVKVVDELKRKACLCGSSRDDDTSLASVESGGIESVLLSDNDVLDGARGSNSKALGDNVKFPGKVNRERSSHGSSQEGSQNGEGSHIERM